MKLGIDMGSTPAGEPATLDLEELLATRLLVQGNSGSGKSHLLRRLLEQSAPWVQQAVVDPEGDFVTLADKFGHVVVDASAHTEPALQRIASRVRQHRVSVVLNLEGLDTEMQMRHAAAFLGGMFEAERDLWYPMLVVVDEAQLFAPAAAGEVSDEARKASLGAMTNLMCRGRKRGLAGVIATQRLAKLAKNVAAEASNFLMGRTFLDIDMARASDLLGMERRQAEMFRDLERGHFVALGPALSRRPLPVRIGTVETLPRASSPKLVPLPETPPANARELILKPGEPEPRTSSALPPPRPRPPAPPPAPTTDMVLQQLARSRPAPLPPPPGSSGASVSGGGNAGGAAMSATAAEAAPVVDGILRQILADPEAAFRPVAVLYQDFLVRCRIHRIRGEAMDLPSFRRKLSVQRAGIDPASADSPEWQEAVATSGGLPEDMQGVFLILARAALERSPCPSDAEIARACGSHSPRRARSLLSYMEQRGFIVCRDDLGGNGRIVALPGLGWESAPGDPQAVPETPRAPSDGSGDVFAPD
ncbi:MAG TPA: ATP-binding protein [Stellaceae bacterium]